MSKIIALDTWIIERLAQPVVDFVWSKIGVSRGVICRTMLFLWGAKIFVDVPSIPLRLVILVLFAMLLGLFEIGEMVRAPGEVMGGMITRIIQIGFLLIFTPMTPFTFGYPISQTLFISFLYLAATKTPPPRKRKDWKAVLDKFSSQWTWLPARQGA